ncbi:MAG: peptidase S41, partial [Planctomycetes bacterium]|nr:peptidase S41 [Planctomycetota bacterium]
EMLEPDIGLLRVEQLDQHSLVKIEEGIGALLSQGMRGLILDLRDNTGGLLDQAVAVSDLFLNQGAIVKLASRLPQERDSFEATERMALPLDLPVVVLVDGRTASAAEIVAGALKQYGRATIIGTRTFGKGAVNKIYPLPDGSGLILTVAHYSIPPGTIIEGNGIEPDIVVGELPPFPSGSDRDEVDRWIAEQKKAGEQQLECARKFLQERVQ